MYKNNVETLPRNLQKELVNTLRRYWLLDEGFVSLESKKNTRHNSKKIIKAFSKKSLPDFWVIAPKEENYDAFYLVFETKLTFVQKFSFFIAVISNSLCRDIMFKSLSSKYSIH